MTFDEFRTRYSLASATLLSVSPEGRMLTLETELISARCPISAPPFPRTSPGIVTSWRSSSTTTRRCPKTAA